MSETVSLGETISRIIASRLIDLHTAMPGRVKSYNASNQTADIEPMLMRQVPSGGPEDEDTLETIPILPSVPVMFPSGGSGFFISFPLQEGDTVMLVFNERDCTNYRDTGNLSNPALPTTHGLTSAVAFPVNYGQKNNTFSDASSSNMVIGKDGGSANLTVKSNRLEVGGPGDSVALSSKVDLIVDAISNGVPISMDGGVGYQTSMKLILDSGGAMPWNTSASDLLKVDS